MPVTPPPSASPSPASPSSSPRTGVGLKPRHYGDVLDGAAPGVWFEIHPQNYFGAGGPPRRALDAIRCDHDVSFHSVGLSLGSARGPDHDQLRRLADLARRVEPVLVSDHVSFSAAAPGTLPDLLPLPYTQDAFALMAASIAEVQDALGRPVLIENPSVYLAPCSSTMDEPAFIAGLCRETGCRWLLDINNIFVSAANTGFDAAAYLDAVDPALVGEVHLAGHAREAHPDGDLLIDDHGGTVADGVWALYRRFILRAPEVPVLIEWDTAVPDITTLLGEARKADALRPAPPGQAGTPGSETIHAA